MSDSNKKTKARILSTLSHSALFTGIDMTIRIFSIPFFLRAWGPDFYGEWLLLTSFAQYGSLLPGSIADVIANHFLLKRDSVPNEDLARLFRTTSTLIQRISFLTILVYVPLAYILYQKPHLTANYSRMSTLLILMLSLGSILIGNLVRFPLGVLKGQGHVARGIRWESLFILIDGLIIFFGLYFKIRPAELAALLFLFDLILYTAFKQIEERSLNIAFPEQRQSVDLDLLKPFMTLITGSLSSGLAFSLLNQGLTQVVFLNLGASVTVLFNTLRTLVRSLLLPINLLAAGIRYDLTRAYANRDQELQQRLYFHTLRITQLFLMIGIVTLFFGGEWLLKTWTRNQVTWNSSLFNLLLISMLFASFSGLANQLLYSANQFIRISSWQLGLLIPMVVLGLLRFWPKTPNALGTGFLINEFFFAVVSLLCVRKVFHISWRALIKNLLSFPTYSEILRYLIFPFRR